LQEFSLEDIIGAKIAFQTIFQEFSTDTAGFLKVEDRDKGCLGFFEAFVLLYNDLTMPMEDEVG
jgi:hypothetical protein